MIFMGLVLKIPVAAMLWIVWWAVRAAPEPAEAPPGPEGGHDRGRFRRSPKRPKGPRRGPHGPGRGPTPSVPDCAPETPRRVRPAIEPGAASAHDGRAHV